MLFLFKYRFLQTVRDLPIMFWALAFPLILATILVLEEPDFLLQENPNGRL